MTITVIELGDQPRDTGQLQRFLMGSYVALWASAHTEAEALLDSPDWERQWDRAMEHLDIAAGAQISLRDVMVEAGVSAFEWEGWRAFLKPYANSGYFAYAEIERVAP